MKQNEQKQISMLDYKILTIATLIVVVCMAFITLTIQKTTTILGFSLAVGSIWFSILSFPVVEAICNEYGKKIANFTFLVAWFGILITTILSRLTILFPSTQSFAQHDATFNFLLSNSWRYLLVTSVSSIGAHLINNELFALIKLKTDSKYLWLRDNVATLVAQIFNALAFTAGMFIGTRSWGELSALFIGTMIMRLVVTTILNTPLTYIGVWIIRKVKATENHVGNK